jgi:hypothetical protein
LLTKGPRYFFDQEAVREPAEYGYRPTRGGNIYDRVGNSGSSPEKTPGVVTHGGDPSTGRNVRSVWEIATQPYPEAHFATFPEALPERCIRAGTSERGCCPECGAPWERVTEVDTALAESRRGTEAYQSGGVAKGATWAGTTPGVRKNVTTTGWRPSCDHDREPVPCVVMDIFMGSGTVALVARRLGRRSIGIELNPEYAELCARRLQQLSLFAGATDG